MANSASVRKVKVSIDGVDTDLADVAWSVPVSGGLVGSPAVSYAVHDPGLQQVVSPTAKDIILSIADDQNTMFASPQATTITFNDGTPESKDVKFTGFKVVPNYSVSVGGVNVGAGLVHMCAMLENLNTSIYSPGPSDSTKLDFPTSAGYPSNYMQIVLEELIKKFESVADDGSSQYAISQRIHEDNKELLKIWYKVLDDTFASGPDGFKDYSANEANALLITQEVKKVYINSAGDFFQKVSQFESMFQMQFIPDPTTLSAGKFIDFDDIVGGTPEDKTVSVRSISITAGAKGFIPVTAVIMTGLSSDNTTKLLHISGDGIAVWPETIPPGGGIYNISAPPWLNTMVMPARSGAEVLIDPGLPSLLDLAAYEDKLKAEQLGAETVIELAQKVATSVCRSVYVNKSLENSRATIYTLLDMSWEVGKRYKITQDGGTELFTGFLQSMTHRIGSSPGRTDAATQLSFTHVEATGFTLPNKE